MFRDDDVFTYYENNFLMMQEFHYSLSDLENMVPLEREIYLSMLNEHLKEKVQEAERRSRGG